MWMGLLSLYDDMIFGSKIEVEVMDSSSLPFRLEITERIRRIWSAREPNTPHDSGLALDNQVRTKDSHYRTVSF
jgi:hypothetical protein